MYLLELYYVVCHCIARSEISQGGDLRVAGLAGKIGTDAGRSTFKIPTLYHLAHITQMQHSK